MSDAATRRTVRRCTSILVLPLASLILLYLRTLAYRGLENNLRTVMPVALVLSASLLVGSGLYLLGSVGRSLWNGV